MALEPRGEDRFWLWNGQMDFEGLVGEYRGSHAKLRTTVLASSFTLLYTNGRLDRSDTNSICSFCYPKLTETKEMKDLLQYRSVGGILK